MKYTGPAAFVKPVRLKPCRSALVLFSACVIVRSRTGQTPENLRPPREHFYFLRNTKRYSFPVAADSSSSFPVCLAKA